MFTVSFSDSQRQTLTAIVDTFVASLDVDEEAKLIENTLRVPGSSACFDREQLVRFAKTSGSSINVVDKIERKLPLILTPQQLRDLLLVINLLDYRPASILMTGHWKSFKDIPRSERELVVTKWRKSSFAVFRQIYNSLMGLSLTEAYFSHDTELYQGLHYNGIQGGYQHFKQQSDYQPIQHERLKMIADEEVAALSAVTFDVIIVGSGAGASIVAAQLAEAGFSVLVLEKGKYYHQDDMTPDDDQHAFSTMYEDGGIAPNATGTVNVLSGSTFGGGTAINYLACLEPSDDVRKQWAEKSGLSYFNSPQFQEDLSRAADRIGVSTDNIVHSGPNQKLIEGCKKLGHTVKTVPQNTSGRSHHCGKCYTGCASGIKNSTTNTWLKDAASHGAQFLDCTRVNGILIRKGKAVGVSCNVHHSQQIHKLFAKRVVVAGGALHTPSLLKRSGLSNPNIGQHLRLHLASICVGIYDQATHPSQGALLTAVCDAFENWEGTHHGFKIECFTQGLGMFSGMVPWLGAAKHKETMLRYRNAVITFAMMRDKDSKCSVQYDPYGKVDVSCDLSKHDEANLVQGIVEMARIHVAAGARQIHVSQHPIDSFEFDANEESCVDHPRFLAWIQSVQSQAAPVPSSGHQMASCRMGASPKTSATKSTGETWDVGNLYVADSSLFPTALGVNPMLTIQAIALHVSRQIVDSLCSNTKMAAKI
ncbi:long chain fatty acid oxidase [Mucor ambiguus]|uniref:Long-chain-alcohol oxidase n=1 Tax=Mucor ambiguus TaxID=91626 RepID=A0A0C9MD68_9FUNG|nr:long chain fatty acid oxidase [Mucor ambiguus]